MIQQNLVMLIYAHTIALKQIDSLIREILQYFLHFRPGQSALIVITLLRKMMSIYKYVWEYCSNITNHHITNHVLLILMGN